MTPGQAGLRSFVAVYTDFTIYAHSSDKVRILRSDRAPLALGLEQAGHAATRIETKAVVTLDKDGDGFSITTVDLTCRAKVDGIDAASFDKIAKATKEGCPVSKVLKATINLDAKLES